MKRLKGSESLQQPVFPSTCPVSKSPRRTTAGATECSGWQFVRMILFPFLAHEAAVFMILNKTMFKMFDWVLFL